MTISTDHLIFPCGMSRSGTTLLATILDSHSHISMGYELIPPPLPEPATLLDTLDRALELTSGDLTTCGKELRETGCSQEGLFFVRCHRAGLEEGDLRNVLQQMQAKGLGKISNLQERLYLAWMVAKESARKRGSRRYGFKLNIPSVETAYSFFPGGRLVYILRDPRDVVSSHIQRRFDRTVEDICLAWNNYIHSFSAFLKKEPERGMVIRYEDLVTAPEKLLPAMCQFLEIPLESALYEFYKSKAGVHSQGHPNAENLKKDFFTTSIGRWETELETEQVEMIERMCGAAMAVYGYG